ncbi:Hsp33 family molecular chaperone HslO [Luteimonas aquatica]|uniref:Hsp33 family molecular chaperone HslO n=1 Tax=Luteimonas aquatica TaxID=450364 RepID=UPI001F574E7B|nr:Hsp33 family molecular chaperone HslO [Luteimonas aquatica]
MSELPDPSIATADDDRLSRFLLEHAGIRGVHVSLADTWAQIRGRDDYPLAVAELLGEAAAAAALFTGHAKIDGRLSVQLRGDGALRTLFAECTAAGTLRGIAQMAEGVEAPVSRDLRALGPEAMLAITIENPGIAGREPMRYQGIVALSTDSLSGAFEQYFAQSEQLPTRLLLAADGHRAAGLMLQKLPGDAGDDDGWTRAGALFDTLGPAELLATPAQTLLRRLFHEEAPTLLGARPLRFACSCSRERVASMLQSLGPEEARAAVIGGSARIRCEFCGQEYRFSPADIDALFTGHERPMEAPERWQ